MSINDAEMSTYLAEWMNENPTMAFALFIVDDGPDAFNMAMIGRNDMAPGVIGRMLARTARDMLAVEQ